LSGFAANFDNFKFFYELIITQYSKFFKKNELEKFTALAANYLALLQKEKAPFGFFVFDEFRRGHGVRRERANYLASAKWTQRQW
jgi:hypothetical protein